MNWIRFQVVKLSKSVRGSCAVCGKKCTRTYTVEHTINPFNKNANGAIKTGDEVAADVSAELAKKAAGPLKHAGCEK